MHQNNVEALRYADEVIAQFLSSFSWSHDRFFSIGMTPVPKRIHVKYLEPGLWGDRLKIETHPTGIQQEKVINTILVEREHDSKGVMQATYQWDLVDLNIDRERALPPELRASLSALVERVGGES